MNSKLDGKCVEHARKLLLSFTLVNIFFSTSPLSTLSCSLSQMSHTVQCSFTSVLQASLFPKGLDHTLE